jgi:hypothetical protein
MAMAMGRLDRLHHHRHQFALQGAVIESSLFAQRLRNRLWNILDRQGWHCVSPAHQNTAKDGSIMEPFRNHCALGSSAEDCLFRLSAHSKESTMNAASLIADEQGLSGEGLSHQQPISLRQARKLIQAMAHEQSFLLLAPPGVGKSDIVFEFFRVSRAASQHFLQPRVASLRRWTLVSQFAQQHAPQQA